MVGVRALRNRVSFGYPKMDFNATEAKVETRRDMERHMLREVRYGRRWVSRSKLE